MQAQSKKRDMSNRGFQVVDDLQIIGEEDASISNRKSKLDNTTNSSISEKHEPVIKQPIFGMGINAERHPSL